MSGPRFGYTQVREVGKLELRPTVNGKLLTPEEAEACAVLVACMRRGWDVGMGHDGSTEIRKFVFLDRIDDDTHVLGQNFTSPAKAYLEALQHPLASVDTP